MKKIFIYGVLCMSLLASCDNGAKKAQEELADQKALNEATREELESAITERDELLDIINEITASVDQIRGVEKIITVNGAVEGNSKTQLKSDLSAIQATLAERREKLANLEAKLKDSKVSNTKLLETIDNLKKQIDTQEAQIKELTASLDTANRRIGQLGHEVDSLNTTVQTVTVERDVAQEEAISQANKANECYYAIGNKKELKDHGILESGFLRKTKIMQGEFDKSYFVKADKRTLSTIPLLSKKAKVITTAQPKGSYEIIDVDGQKVLRILNAREFWGVSNYVVIQID